MLWNSNTWVEQKRLNLSLFRSKGKQMRSKQDALEFHSVGKEDLLNKSPINRRRVRKWICLFHLVFIVESDA